MYEAVDGDVTGVEKPLIPNVVGADDVKFPLTCKELLDKTRQEPLKSLKVLQVKPPLFMLKYVGIEIWI